MYVYTLFQKPGASRESRHCEQDKRIFFCPVHNASTPCSFQAFGIRCIDLYYNFNCTWIQGILIKLN